MKARLVIAVGLSAMLLMAQSTQSFSMTDIAKGAHSLYQCGRSQGMLDVSRKMGLAITPELEEVNDSETCKAARQLLDLIDGLAKEGDK